MTLEDELEQLEQLGRILYAAGFRVHHLGIGRRHGKTETKWLCHLKADGSRDHQSIPSDLPEIRGWGATINEAVREAITELTAWWMKNRSQEL